MTIALLLLTVPRAGSCETPMGEEALKELSVPAVVAKVRPSVVTVLTRGIPPGGSQHGAPSGSGSGVIIDVGGYILTNNHLVQGMTSVVVGLSTGRLTPGRVVARDFLLDLALIRITAPDLVPAEFSRRTTFDIGETAIAIGNPLALKGGSTVTVGVISALDRSVLTPEGETLYDLLQTDAAINPGNSGGPLVDRFGQVIGINVAIAPSAQAISYAIAMDAITPHIQSMIDRGAVSRPDLGLVPVTVTPSVAASFDLESDRGILALQVDAGKPAGQAGLQSGDVVSAIDGRQIFNIGDFWHAVARAGEQMTFQIAAQGKTGTNTITVPRPPSSRP
ncbi:MAG: trypsin-like peptidase domain-containing protein [Nitrospira sp.]|nr:MAG: trypsin-like peptidase domain-containing protein [Nitrospira sp.]